MTQEDLAGAAQIDQTYVSGMENGKRNPSINMLEKLGHALSVDPQVLLAPIKRKDAT